MDGLGESGESVASPIPLAEPTEPAPITKTVRESSFYIDVHGKWGSASVEEMIAFSPVVVRATLGSVRPVGLQLGGADSAWQGSLEFTFEVVEYLKGSGGTTLRAVAQGWPNDENLVSQTEAEAVEKARALLDARDARWDDREAVVFLRLPWWAGAASGVYWLGEVGLFYKPGHNRSTTVADDEFKAWLPDAEAGTATSTDSQTTARSQTPQHPSKGQRFLLDDPASPSSGSEGSGAARSAGSASSATPATQSIALATLKSKIAQIEARIAAGGGSQAYRDCVAKEHRVNRRYREVPYRRLDGAVESGAPAGTRMVTDQDSLVLSWNVPDQQLGEIWYEGQDAELMEFEPPAYTVSTRPLPAGVYRAFVTGRGPELMVCQAVVQNNRGKNEHVVTVSAPEGTLSEAFFDPATSSAAFVGTTTVGTIGWENDTVSATLTLDATGHTLDFIDLNGTTILSLAVADAAGATSTLSWAVASQPWSGGDKLMLRVRKAPPR